MNLWPRHVDSCPAEGKLRAWLAAGARFPITFVRGDFTGRPFSLTALVFSSGTLAERCRQRWRSFCSWLAMLSPLSGWKVFWYRRAGVSIGADVYISPDAVIDLLFPQLITLEDEVVVGFGAMIMAHVYTPDRIVIGRTPVRRRALVGGRGIIAINEIGEGGVLGANSWAIESIPPGHIAIGVPATIHNRKCNELPKKSGPDDNSA